MARNEWQNTVYPCVPGHEIVGRVVQVGEEVKKFKEGDLAASAAWSIPAATATTASDGLEQYCENGFTLTYNSAGQALGGHDLRRLLAEHRRRSGVSCCAIPAEARSGGGRAAALRGHHHLFAAAPLEGRPRARRSASSASAAWVTWA